MLGHTHALIGLGALVTVELVARQVLEPGLVQPHQVRGCRLDWLYAPGQPFWAR